MSTVYQPGPGYHLTCLSKVHGDLFTDARGRLSAKPSPDAVEVDLRDYLLLPALVNPHDHLELNHYPRTKFRERYDNAHQWGEDVNARLDQSPYRELRQHPLADRLFIGGLKNLLCGATTVMHHNPPHWALFRRDFPVRVVRRYGWTHSLHFSSDDEIRASYRATPAAVPWFIHLAEGTDDTAAGEYRRLKALGCVGANTVLIHGVGMTDDDIADAAPRVRGLVVCPSTNDYLLGVPPRSNRLLERWHEQGGRAAVGSDSRLTADGDLLVELAVAGLRDAYDLAYFHCRDAAHRIFIYLDAIVHPTFAALTHDARHIAGIAEHSSEGFGWHDWIVTPYRHMPQSRRQLALVVRGGVPMIGDPDLMAQFRHVPTVAATLDGRDKRIHRTLARRIVQSTLKEPGLEIDPTFH